MKILEIFQKNRFEAKKDVIFWLKVNVPFIFFWIIVNAFNLNEKWIQVAWRCVWWMAIMNAVGLSIQLYEYFVRILVFNILRIKRYSKALFPMSLLDILTWFATFLMLYIITSRNAALLKGFWFVAPRIITVVLVVWTLIKLFVIRK